MQFGHLKLKVPRLEISTVAVLDQHDAFPNVSAVFNAMFEAGIISSGWGLHFGTVDIHSNPNFDVETVTNLYVPYFSCITLDKQL